MVIVRGEIWWADLPEPAASGPGYRRPVLVVQDNDFNRSKIATIVVAIITTNLNVATANGNVSISPTQSGLPKDSVVNVSQLLTLDKSFFIEKVQSLSDAKMEQVNEGLKIVLSLTK
jgi:mRNA interferase MazF